MHEGGRRSRMAFERRSRNRHERNDERIDSNRDHPLADVEYLLTGVAKAGENLNFTLGYSHPVSYKAPSGISFTVEGTTKIHVDGIDKQLVGQVAAEIRNLRPPEPYKGKGIRYEGEFVRKKLGKAGKGAKK